jgi:pSer/pThr/pTyr-binding forkhead associated (FHA) protein
MPLGKGPRMISLRTRARQGEESKQSLTPGRFFVGSAETDGARVPGLPSQALDLEISSDSVIAIARQPGFLLDGQELKVAERRLIRFGEQLSRDGIELSFERPQVELGEGTLAVAKGILAGALQRSCEAPLPTLVWLNGPDCGKRLPILDEAVFIGRGEGSVARVRDGLASRVHARLVVKDDTAKVVDLGSSNGLFVGEEKVLGEKSLTGGEILRIGDTEIAFEAHFEQPKPPPSAPTAAPEPQQDNRSKTDEMASPGNANQRPASPRPQPRRLLLTEALALSAASAAAVIAMVAVWLLLR